MTGKSVRRGLLALGLGFATTPLAMGLGVVLLISTFDEDGDGSVGNPLGGLRIGKGGVPVRYAPLILQAAADCGEGLSPAVLAAQIKQESGFDPEAGPSVAGAKGIAQFMPGTWATWEVDGNGDGRKDVRDPEDAIPAQGRMMCSLLKKGKAHPRYNGSPIELALAGYNAGWGRVDQYQGVPPPSFAGGQTYHYVQNIMRMSADFAARVREQGRHAARRVRTARRNAGEGTRSRVVGPETARRPVPAGRRLHRRAGREPGPLVRLLLLDAAGIPGGRGEHPADHVRPGRHRHQGRYRRLRKPGDPGVQPRVRRLHARPGHVGMYIGQGLIIEAPRTGLTTRIVTYESWRNSTSHLTRITEVRRVVDW
ncbi:hypothetical protein STENM327S_06138 [Streptomyces tendae]